MNLNDSRLLSLLKSGLWNIPLSMELFENIGEDDWKIIFKQSSNQGVIAIIFDGLMHNIKQLNISKKMLLTWTANVEAIEQRYSHQYKVIENLAEIFHKNNINILIFKGISLSSFYPNPSHREGGDIDIYLFGDFEKGNMIMESMGINVLSGGIINPKHTIFYYQDIPIENHKRFFSNSYALRKNNYLESLIIENVNINQCEKHIIGNQVVYFPSNLWNSYYLLGHMSTHLVNSGLTLRLLCDWAVFLNNYYSQIDFQALKYHFSKTDLYKSIQILTSITFHQIGFSSNKTLPFPKLSEKLEAIILDNYVLHPLNQENSDSKNLFKRYKKTVNLFKRVYISRKLTSNKFIFRYLIYLIFKKIRRIKMI